VSIKVAVLTVSDRCSAGAMVDGSGPEIVGWAAACGWPVVAKSVVPDDVTTIADAIADWIDHGVADVVVTTGGTGISPRDVTPEATALVIERSLPGIGEALRVRGMMSTPYAALGRGVAGTRGRALVVNLPGSPGGVRDGLATLQPIIEHAVRQLRGDTEH
jgi:molybdopterin adenylyltransferase